MEEDHFNRQMESQTAKVLNRSALLVFFARIFVLVIFLSLHHWGLAAFIAAGAIVWLWIFRSTSQGHQNRAFVFSLIESSAFFLVCTLAIGWESGAFFSLLVMFPIIVMSGKMTRPFRYILCSLIILVLVFLYLLSQQILIGKPIDPAYLRAIYVLNLLQGSGILVLLTATGEEVRLSSQEEIVRNNKELQTLANTDPLTGLVNRRFMMSLITEEKEKVNRGGRPFSLIMIDVDNFKEINDEFGHDGGDFILVALTEKIKVGLRKNDVVSRWGGDEFLILLPETELKSGLFVAEKVRARINNSPFIYHGVDIPVTITLGVSQCSASTGIGNAIRKADLALYKGKQNGKNRTTSFG